MNSLIGEWTEKIVAVTLRVGGIAGAVTLHGRLLRVDSSGVLLEQPKGQAFVPVSAILHVVLANKG